VRFYLALLLFSAIAGPDKGRVCVVTAEAIAAFHEKIGSINFQQQSTRRSFGHNLNYENWPVDGAHTIAGKPAEHLQYSNYFRAPLEGKTFEQFAADRKAQGKTAHVADFFGSAVFSAQPEAFNSLTGIRLKKLDPSALPKNFPAKNWNEVEGDLYGEEVFKELRADMEKRSIPAFDVIICRPEGPLKQLSKAFLTQAEYRDDRPAFFREQHKFLDRAYRTLSAADGKMFLQLTPEIRASREFRAWMTRLKAKNVEAEIFMNDSFVVPVPLLRITKSASSPDTLPE